MVSWLEFLISSVWTLKWDQASGLDIPGAPEQNSGFPHSYKFTGKLLPAESLYGHLVMHIDWIRSEAWQAISNSRLRNTKLTHFPYHLRSSSHSTPVGTEVCISHQSPGVLCSPSSRFPLPAAPSTAPSVCRDCHSKRLLCACSGCNNCLGTHWHSPCSRSQMWNPQFCYFSFMLYYKQLKGTRSHKSHGIDQPSIIQSTAFNFVSLLHLYMGSIIPRGVMKRIRFPPTDQLHFRFLTRH